MVFRVFGHGRLSVMLAQDGLTNSLGGFRKVTAFIRAVLWLG